MAQRLARVRALAAITLAIGAAASCAIDYGELPAKCGDGECPDGYECIHDVCAAPGTAIPTTVARPEFLRSTDLRVIPSGSGVVVLWEVYRYDTELFEFDAARVDADGNVGAPQIVVADYPASANYLEPFFDAIAVDDEHLLFAIGAAPGPEDTYTESRLSLFRVTVPSNGGEASSEPVWEEHMPTIGYGAVSQPHFARPNGQIELAYFQSRSEAGDTLGELAVFDLDAQGEKGAPFSPTCLASRCFETRGIAEELPIAISVVDALATDAHVDWILDDTRPSFVREDVATHTFVGTKLPKLSIPVESLADTLAFVSPSERQGSKLSDDAVAGPAELAQAATDGSTTDLIELATIRDSPRPAYVQRLGAPGLLVTPGKDLGAPELTVYAINLAAQTEKSVATIPRFTGLQIGAVRAVVVDSRLFVVWLDISTDTATIRATVLPEP